MFEESNRYHTEQYSNLYKNFTQNYSNCIYIYLMFYGGVLCNDTFSLIE